MNDSKTILVSQLGVNDENAKLIKWLIKDGDYVANGEVLCELETTKAAFEIKADCSGYISFLAAEGDEVLINDPLAVISPSIEKAKKIKLTHKVDLQKKKEIQNESFQATKKAIDLAKQHDISLENIPVNSGAIIRESDVAAFISEESCKETPEFILNTSSEQKSVVIYGAGKGGITIQETLSKANGFNVVCFVDDDYTNLGLQIGLPVYHSSNLNQLKKKGIMHLALGVASGSIRQKNKNKAEELGFEVINVVHHNSYVSPSVQMGKGNFIKAGAVIDTNTIIGDCCIIDNGAIIAHDNVIENGCHIAPGATFGSSIVLGQNTVVGIGANISTNIKIGKNCIIAVGASVTQHFDDSSLIDGVPGRLIGKTKL